MKIKNQIGIVLSTVVASVLLVGCGSGSSSSSIPTSSPITSTTPSIGYFIDAAVAGADYNTSSGLYGTTDANGSFAYHNGDKVTFILGGLILGECEPATDGLVTPKTLVVGDGSVPSTQQAKAVALLLRTLQSLDKDNNASNGIEIDTAVIQKLAKLNTKVDFEDINESYLIELDNKYDLGIDKDFDGHLDINETEAEKHFDESVKKWKNEEKDRSDENKTVVYKENYDENKTFRFQEHDDENETVLYKEKYDTNQSIQLTEEMQNTLISMLNEQKLAYDIYMNLYNYHKENSTNEIKQFYNIASKSVIKQYEAVRSLVKKYGLKDSLATKSINDAPNGVYDIQAVQDKYNNYYSLGQGSLEGALKVGCMVEVTDINDLNKSINIAQDTNTSDVVSTIETLKEENYNEYWALDKALKGIGITNGCYYEGDALLTNKADLYPTSTSSTSTSSTSTSSTSTSSTSTSSTSAS